MNIIKKLIPILLLGISLLVVLFVALIALLMVPPASARTVEPLVVTFSHTGSGFGADPEDDFFIYVEEYASPFRINRAVEGGFQYQDFITEIQPGDQIEIWAFDRYFPNDPEREILLGSIPAWTVVHDGVTFMLDRQPQQLSD